jgi:hypothetical protein
LAVCAASLLVSRAAADGGAQTPIAADRPAVTASSIAVPAGSLQFENGFAATANQGATTYDGPEALIRFGVASKTEMRLTVPNYFGTVGGNAGFGDVAIGMKQQLGPAAGFDVSLILTLSLPSGASGISSG